MIKTFENTLFGKVNVELYGSANAMVDDLEARKATDERFDKDHWIDRHWVGATKEEAYNMLRTGYQPVVDRLKSTAKFSARGVGKRTYFKNEPVGFVPIVPNAILGLPDSMINSHIKPIKTKVLDVFYDMTASSCTSSEDIIKAGEKMLGTIVELEAQGYRFNLYAVQTYYGDRTGADILCVRIKSASQPLDIKRMSFPATHSAFFRGIGFDWYSKCPVAKFRFGYGHAISYDFENEKITEEFRKMFGRSAVYFACTKIMKKDKEYLKGVLTNGKVD